MKKRSAVSLTVLDGEKNDIDSRLRCSENCEPLLGQVLQQLKLIKKQLKQKVNRSEFMSSLSTKVSLSQLGSWSHTENSSKENTCPNRYNRNNQEAYNKIQDQVDELAAEIKQNNIKQVWEEFENLQQSQISMKIKYEELAVRLQEKMNQVEEDQKQRLAEVEAYIYRKAERSQIEKLFNLNELLVIEIQQAKQKVEDYQKENNYKIKSITQRIHHLELEHQKGKQQIQGLESRVVDQMGQRTSQMDRILDILEAKQTNRQQNEYFYDTNIESLHKRVKKIQDEQNLFVKQLVTRVSVLQLKQNHITRAVKQVDFLRNQTQAFKSELVDLYSKLSEVNPNVRQLCQSTTSALRDQLSDTFNANIEHACQSILHKILIITDNLVSFEQVNQLLNPLQEKNRQLQQTKSEIMRKIQYLDKKQVEIEDNTEQEIQKNEERLSSLRKQFKNFLTHKQFKQVALKFPTIEEIKEIGKQIDKKIENQIEKVVNQQEKINQVLCSQNIMAKWFWSSGGLKGGNLVAWDRQIVNTFPQNFKWTKSEPLILINKGGYYRVQMGFYSKKKPTVQVIVNGQTIISAVNSNSYVVHHSSGKLKDVSNSEIAGLTYVDYFLLPDQSRIVTSYVGEFTGEGFLTVHRI